MGFIKLVLSIDDIFGAILLFLILNFILWFWIVIKINNFKNKKKEKKKNE